jgi:surfeit locus 1 family protein
MGRSRVLLLAMSLVAGAICVRLGFWQIDRLHQRRERNAEALSRFAEPPLPMTGSGAGLARFRRVTANGVFDFSREFIIAGRARLGAPGVHIVTPLQFPGTDSVMLVLRGWVYSPDATAIDFARWREPDSTSVDGYLAAFDGAGAGADTTASGVLRRLTRPAAEGKAGPRIFPYYLVMTGGGASPDSALRRLEAPIVDDGPHLSYAVQWFLFATVFGAGGLFVTFRRQRPPLAERSA